MKTNAISKVSKLIGRLIIVLFLVQLDASSTMAQPNLEDLVRPWRLIFKGTIKAVNASNLRSIPVTDSTGIVTVDEVVYRPGTLGNFTAKDITIKLASPAKIGLQAVFFIDILLYGSTLGVQEIGRIEGREVPPDLRKQIDEVLLKLADQALLRRIELAELIVVGKVSRSKPISEQQVGMASEHSPDWWETVIQIESVEKGGTIQDSVTVLFPNSQDELWSESPKFVVGQEGIWILQKDQMEKGPPVMRRPGFTALDPLDFHSKDQLERIRRLIKGSG